VLCRINHISPTEKEAVMLKKNIKVPREYIVALAIALVYAVLRYRLSPTAPYLLSDSLFVAGMTLVTMGAANVVHNSGLFDFTRRGFKIFKDLWAPREKGQNGGSKPGPDTTVKKPMGATLYLIMGGLVFIIASVAAGAASL
jgi:hypothetical protein